VRRIGFIARKEFYHILRDFRSLIIVIAMPIMMVIIYGYAINMDIENLTIAVVDYDHTAESRELVEDFCCSNYFSLGRPKVDLSDPEQLLRSGQVNAILYIQHGFGKAIANREPFVLGMTVDGADASLATAMQSYSNAVVQQYQRKHLPEGFELPGVRLSPQVMYNPNLYSSHFLVPGLVAIILMMISALLTSITIAREKETGTLEQLLTTPVKPREILIGKLLPYILIAFVDGILVLLFARLVFGVPFVGSHLLLLSFGLIYVTTALSIGILISTVSQTQMVAMTLAQVATLLPSVMLSGFIFALKNMPLVLQIISNVIAAKYFVTIIRGIMLKGAGLDTLAIHGGALVVLMLILLTIAMKRFKGQVG